MNACQDIEAARAAADKAGEELLEQDLIRQHASPRTTRKKKKKGKTMLSNIRSEVCQANDMPILTGVPRRQTQIISN